MLIMFGKLDEFGDFLYIVEIQLSFLLQFIVILEFVGNNMLSLV